LERVPKLENPITHWGLGKRRAHRSREGTGRGGRLGYYWGANPDGRYQ